MEMVVLCLQTLPAQNRLGRARMSKLVPGNSVYSHVLPYKNSLLVRSAYLYAIMCSSYCATLFHARHGPVESSHHQGLVKNLPSRQFTIHRTPYRTSGHLPAGALRLCIASVTLRCVCVCYHLAGCPKREEMRISKLPASQQLVRRSTSRALLTCRCQLFAICWVWESAAPYGTLPTCLTTVPSNSQPATCRYSNSGVRSAIAHRTYTSAICAPFHLITNFTGSAGFHCTVLLP